MARPEVTDCAVSPELDALSIAEFCVAHRISTSFYFKLKQQGLTPAEMKLGSRILISKESAKAWRAARTAETAA
jgi:hypothetical protein